MGFFSSIGSALGTVLGGPLGGAVGGALGGLVDGKPKQTQLDAYTAAKIQREKRWEAMFGSIEKNIAAHYNNLSANQHIAKSNQALEEQFSTMQQRLTQTLAQRGLNVEGGVANAATTQMLSELSKAKAKVYATADEWVAQQQQQGYTTMRASRPDASGATQANAQMNYNLNAYNDKMGAAGIASAIDVGKQIYDQFNPKTEVVKADNYLNSVGSN